MILYWKFFLWHPIATLIFANMFVCKLFRKLRVQSKYSLEFYVACYQKIKNKTGNFVRIISRWWTDITNSTYKNHFWARTNYNEPTLMLIMNFFLTIHDVNDKIPWHKPFSWLEITIDIMIVCKPPHSGGQVPARPGSPHSPEAGMSQLAWGQQPHQHPMPLLNLRIFLIIGLCYLISQFCLFSVDIVVGGGHGALPSEIGTTQELSRQTRNLRDTGRWAHSELGTYGSNNRKWWLIFSSWPVFIA